MDASIDGPVDVEPTRWSGLAIAAAATAALASFLATAERGVAGRSTAPVLGPGTATVDPTDLVDATPPGAPGPAARPDPAHTGRRRRSRPAGRVRARLLDSLPSRER